MDRIFVAIDVETTGLEAGVDEIIEVAAVKFRPGEVLETFARLIRPRHTLPLKTSRLTHITPEMLTDAPRFSEVAPDLAKCVPSSAVAVLGPWMGSRRAQRDPVTVRPRTGAQAEADSVRFRPPACRS